MPGVCIRFSVNVVDWKPTVVKRLKRDSVLATGRAHKVGPIDPQP